MTTVRFELDGAVGRIRLDRPDASNSVDLATAEAFGDAVSRAEADDVRAVLVEATGPRFCAGGDLAAMVAADDPGDYLHRLAQELDGHLQRLASLPKPVVAAVHGSVAGAGLSFVLSADLTVAARSTRFVVAYSGVGLTPDCGVSWLLPRAVGHQRAVELAFTNRVLDAAEAHAWGLVNEVVDDADLPEQGRALAGRLADGPTAAFADTKRLLRAAWTNSRVESGADEAKTIAAAVVRPEASGRIEAFLTRS